MVVTCARRILVAFVVFGLLLPILAGCQTGAARDRSPGTLRVLTYNIHHGEGADKVFDYRRLAKVIRSLSPDIVAVQEVDCRTERSSGVDQAATLARLCRMHYVFGQAMPHQGGQYGEAILSRFLIRRTATHPLPYEVGVEPRAAVEVLIEPPGLPPITFVGTHLCHQKPEVRVQQARRLNELFGEPKPDPNKPASKPRWTHPVILAGDFNSRPGSDPMTVLLDAGWVDTVAPRSVIDYVLTRRSDPWLVKEVFIIDEPVASDHSPVLVTLQWQDESR